MQDSASHTEKKVAEVYKVLEQELELLRLFQSLMANNAPIACFLQIIASHTDLSFRFVVENLSSHKMFIKLTFNPYY